MGVGGFPGLSEATGVLEPRTDPKLGVARRRDLTFLAADLAFLAADLASRRLLMALRTGVGSFDVTHPVWACEQPARGNHVGRRSAREGRRKMRRHGRKEIGKKDRWGQNRREPTTH